MPRSQFLLRIQFFQVTCWVAGNLFCDNMNPAMFNGIVKNTHILCPDEIVIG